MSLSDFDTHEEGLVSGSVGEGDDDLTAAVGSSREGFDEGCIESDRSVDIEVTEHSSAIDGYVKDTVAFCGVVGLRKMQQDGDTRCRP